MKFSVRLIDIFSRDVLDLFLKNFLECRELLLHQLSFVVGVAQFVEILMAQVLLLKKMFE